MNQFLRSLVRNAFWGAVAFVGLLLIILQGLAHATQRLAAVVEELCERGLRDFTEGVVVLEESLFPADHITEVELGDEDLDGYDTRWGHDALRALAEGEIVCLRGVVERQAEKTAEREAAARQAEQERAEWDAMSDVQRFMKMNPSVTTEEEARRRMGLEAPSPMRPDEILAAAAADAAVLGGDRGKQSATNRETFARLDAIAAETRAVVAKAQKVWGMDESKVLGRPASPAQLEAAGNAVGYMNPPFADEPNKAPEQSSPHGYQADEQEHGVIGLELGGPNHGKSENFPNLAEATAVLRQQPAAAARGMLADVAADLAEEEHAADKASRAPAGPPFLRTANEYPGSIDANMSREEAGRLSS